VAAAAASLPSGANKDPHPRLTSEMSGGAAHSAARSRSGALKFRDDSVPSKTHSAADEPGARPRRRKLFARSNSRDPLREEHVESPVGTSDHVADPTEALKDNFLIDDFVSLHLDPAEFFRGQ